MVKKEERKSFSTFIVQSSHGEFLATAPSGRVAKMRIGLDSDAVWPVDERPIRFDTAEWERYYNTLILDGQVIDILDIGYWMCDGSYEPPIDEARMGGETNG